MWLERYEFTLRVHKRCGQKDTSLPCDWRSMRCYREGLGGHTWTISTHHQSKSDANSLPNINN